MIKILHFITDTNIGGAGKLLCTQIRNMNRKDFEVSVALPSGSSLIAELSVLPCKIIELTHGADSSFSARATIEAYKLIKQESPDVVHSHASLSSRLAAIALRTPNRFFTRHCSFAPSPFFSLAPINKLMGMINNRLSTAFIAVAEVVKEDLIKLGCDGEKIYTVVNGSDPLRTLDENERYYMKAKYGLDKNNFVVSIIARLESYKGHEVLLRAAAMIKQSYPSFRFFVVGNGSKMNELRTKAEKLGVSDVVHFCGFCSDVAPILSITDVNVNCSNVSETSSIALCEGMSIGIPSVASECKGNNHMVKNEVNGLLFPIDNANALALCLIRLYCEKDLYEKCSNGARKRYEAEFNSKAMTRKMEEIYKKEYTAHKLT